MKKIDAKEKVNNPIKEKDLTNFLGVEKFKYGEVEEQNRGSAIKKKKILTKWQSRIRLLLILDGKNYDENSYFR